MKVLTVNIFYRPLWDWSSKNLQSKPIMKMRSWTMLQTKSLNPEWGLGGPPNHLDCSTKNSKSSGLFLLWFIFLPQLSHQLHLRFLTFGLQIVTVVTVIRICKYDFKWFAEYIHICNLTVMNFAINLNECLWLRESLS